MPDDLARNGIVYFTDNELRCKGSGLLILAPGFGNKLIDLRMAFDRSMMVTSGCRSTDHNRRSGGAPGSYHICDTGRGCCTVDIRTTDAQYRAALAKIALNMGWSVGVNKSFLHLDRRTDYHPWDPQLMFLY